MLSSDAPMGLPLGLDSYRLNKWWGDVGGGGVENVGDVGGKGEGAGWYRIYESSVPVLRLLYILYYTVCIA